MTNMSTLDRHGQGHVLLYTYRLCLFSSTCPYRAPSLLVPIRIYTTYLYVLVPDGSESDLTPEVPEDDLAVGDAHPPHVQSDGGRYLIQRHPLRLFEHALHLLQQRLKQGVAGWGNREDKGGEEVSR